MDDGATLEEVDEAAGADEAIGAEEAAGEEDTTGEEAAEDEEAAGVEEAAGDRDWEDDEGVTGVAAALDDLDDTALDADGEPETALKLAPQTLALLLGAPRPFFK